MTGKFSTEEVFVSRDRIDCLWLDAGCLNQVFKVVFTFLFALFMYQIRLTILDSCIALDFSISQLAEGQALNVQHSLVRGLQLLD